DQPNWRPRSALCHAYYDGKQFNAQQEAMIIAERLDRRVTNLVRPVINSVLGQEAKARTDVKIEADDDDYQDVVDALAKKFKEAERETCAHMAVSNGYGGMVKGGIGWVEV
ncbi:portal protein, partial [Salmonella enterica]|uniref:portal protein n=1 Tax=Salmonella enterica TaxID=28901 RepID=UPI003FA6F68F